MDNGMKYFRAVKSKTFEICDIQRLNRKVEICQMYDKMYLR